eukprot:GSChrysophyteH1.ASY1.ANO1.3096.1 assembled CDS
MKKIKRPAYLDAKGIRWDTNDADLEGVMSKKSKWIGEWRERYFILKGSKMFFTKSSEEAPHGIIDLVDCLSVQGSTQHHKEHTLEIVMRNDERFVLCARSNDHKEAWITAVRRAIGIASSAHYDERG